MTYRTGNHWGVTVVREGTEPPDEHGKRPDAQLVAVVVNGDQALAERICALLNGDGRCYHGEDCDGSGPECEREAKPRLLAAKDLTPEQFAEFVEAYRQPTDSCTCTIVGPDPACPVHQGRRARGPKPPPLGPGCICDCSGRTCPRHGVVL